METNNLVLLKLLMILEEQKQFFLQKIEILERLEMDKLCEEMNNSPSKLRESQKIFDEFKNEFNVGAVSNFADLFDLLETLNELEKMNGLEFWFEMGKQEHELEKMDDPEPPWEWDTHEQSEDTAREEIEMRRGIEMMRGEILEYIHTMHLEQELQELPELDDEYTMPDEAMPEDEAMPDFSSLDKCDKLDDFDALFHFQEQQVENQEDELMQKEEKEIQKLRDELEKMDESKSGKLMLRL